MRYVLVVRVILSKCVTIAWLHRLHDTGFVDRPVSEVASQASRVVERVKVCRGVSDSATIKVHIIYGDIHPVPVSRRAVRKACSYSSYELGLWIGRGTLCVRIIRQNWVLSSATATLLFVFLCWPGNGHALLGARSAYAKTDGFLFPDTPGLETVCIRRDHSHGRTHVACIHLG